MRAELEAYHGLTAGKLLEVRGGPEYSLAEHLRQTDAKSARNAYPQTSAGALFLIAMWRHYTWQTKCAAGSKASWLWSSLCGVLLGIGFWFNYQIADARLRRIGTVLYCAAYGYASWGIDK